VFGGVPTPLDPFEARRLLFAMLLISALARDEIAPTTPASASTRAPSAARGGSGVVRRTHARPPRSC
jgi:hypothetical protein